MQRQAVKGSTFQLLAEPPVRLAELICAAVPCAEKVRFTSTGTEATMLAIRMARVFTGREKVVKFEGGWHGLHDYAMLGNWGAAAASYPTPVPDVGGIPKGTLDSVLVAPFNDCATLREIFELYGQEIAAVIVEPLQRAIRPEAGFLEALRELTRGHGAVLIFDEVVTGFRLAYGGAQEYYRVTPDLATYGKAVSCGFPLGAICGRADVMETANPARKGTLHYAALSGTLSGNPLACAAGVAALAELRRPGVYERLHAVGARLREGMARVAARAGVPFQALGDGPIAQPVFLGADQRVTADRDLRGADAKRATRLGHEMIRRGIFVLPGAKMYVSLAHSDEDLTVTLAVFEEALQASAKSTAA